MSQGVPFPNEMIAKLVNAGCDSITARAIDNPSPNPLLLFMPRGIAADLEDVPA
jgi:hypothetical protein